MTNRLDRFYNPNAFLRQALTVSLLCAGVVIALTLFGHQLLAL